MACAHFVSRLAENSNRYWSKDECIESIEAFNADKDNFEYFLQIFAQGREKKDLDIVESYQTFFEDLPQRCMYLEMCVLPRFYISVLKTSARSETFVSSWARIQKSGRKRKVPKAYDGGR